jgi:hypothetical protein
LTLAVLKYISVYLKIMCNDSAGLWIYMFHKFSFMRHTLFPVKTKLQSQNIFRSKIKFLCFEFVLLLDCLEETSLSLPEDIWSMCNLQVTLACSDQII